MTIYKTAAAGAPVRVRVLSDPFGGETGTLTLDSTSPVGRQLFVITLDNTIGTVGEVFLYPDSYEVEPIGEDN